MSKEKFLIVFTFLTIINVMCAFSIGSNKMIDKNESFNNKSNFVAMMVETDDGVYERSTSNEWLTDGYEFNEELSKCENGGELSWDSSKNSVVLTGNAGDKCYVFFDKDNSFTFSSFDVSYTETSITINVDISSINGDISKYYYSIDDGKNYTASFNNSYTFNNIQLGTYKVKFYAEDITGKKSGVKSKEINVKARPSNPSLAFDDTYNILFSGSTSKNGEVTYYYSFDNKSFTRGNNVSVSNTSIIYVYAMDVLNEKSDVISKNITIGTPTNGTVSSTYYCSKTASYQSSSTCTYNYTGTRSSSPVCNSAKYPTYHNGKCGSRQIYNYSKSECGSWCSDVADRENPASYACVQEGTGTESWSCYFYSAEDPYPYSCPNGGTLSGTTCYNATYSASTRYKCSVNNTYYTSNSSATTACTNYCATGTYYNNKCYSLS